MALDRGLAARGETQRDASRAVAYLVEVYAALGLAPVGDDHAHPLWITGTQEAERVGLALASERGPIEIDAGDLVALAESGDGEAAGELVFVGYAAQSQPSRARGPGPSWREIGARCGGRAPSIHARPSDLRLEDAVGAQTHTAIARLIPEPKDVNRREPVRDGADATSRTTRRSGQE